MHIEVIFWSQESFVHLRVLDLKNKTSCEHPCHNKLRTIFDFGHSFENLKVPLAPRFFLSRQKGPFCSDHIGEKVIVVWFFLDFLWIFKIHKIRPTVVHHQVTRRMGWVGLWRQPGKPILLWEMMRQWRDCRSGITERLFRGKNLQCHIGVLLWTAIMWWICVNVYILYTTYLPLAIKVAQNSFQHIPRL